MMDDIVDRMLVQYVDGKYILEPDYFEFLLEEKKRLMLLESYLEKSNIKLPKIA